VPHIPLTVTVVSTLWLSHPFLFLTANKVRYQDMHHSSGMIAPQYDYSLNTEQPLILDTTLELPSSSARQVTFPQYSLPPRNQLGLDFPPHSPHIPPPAHAGPQLDFRYSERGGSSHDHSYICPAANSSSMPMESDHRSSLATSSTRSDASPPADACTSARESRKEIPSVVIACRQWCVHCRSLFNFILTFFLQP